jgi:quercetin dioxygenase-like cupin family protein
MDPFSRRGVLAFSAAGAVAVAASTANAAVLGNPDEPPQGGVNANPGSLRDPGPQNPALASQFPSSTNPPATDVGDMPQFWASFNNAHRRVQNGGWARQVTQADFPISRDFSGVNMRLSAGGIRELHWHLAAEWAFMTYGSCRVTVLDTDGRAYVEDVKEGDLWFFPAGYPHSLQGLGPDGCEFVIVFDDGNANEFNTISAFPLMLSNLSHGTICGFFRARSLGRFPTTREQSAAAACRHIPSPSHYLARRHVGETKMAFSRSRTARPSRSPAPSRRRLKPSGLAESGKCTGIPMPTSGNTISRGRHA